MLCDLQHHSVAATGSFALALCPKLPISTKPLGNLQLPSGGLAPTNLLLSATQSPLRVPSEWVAATGCSCAARGGCHRLPLCPLAAVQKTTAIANAHCPSQYCHKIPLLPRGWRKSERPLLSPAKAVIKK